MPKMTASNRVLRKKRLASFTLVELLTVMAIIAILSALVLEAASGVWQQAARKRAMSEVQAMSAALESYKIDNGIYPSTNTVAWTTNQYANNDGSQVGGTYQLSSQLLYLSLSGQTNFADMPAAGTRAYMSFKANQVGNPAAGGSYVKDPWNYSYGYSTGVISSPPKPTDAAPFNGSGFFDLWSTGGLLMAKMAATPTLTNAWISNWQ